MARKRPVNMFRRLGLRMNSSNSTPSSLSFLVNTRRICLGDPEMKQMRAAPPAQFAQERRRARHRALLLGRLERRAQQILQRIEVGPEVGLVEIPTIDVR